MDTYFKKEVTYSFAGRKFKFDVGETLFSTFNLDRGTDVLLRSIDSKGAKTILDIGCGWGPIGIILAKNNPHAQVTLVDRDLLAVRYSSYNIAKNNIQNAKALDSIGMEQLLDYTYDLIVSNIPAKIGDKAIAEEFILTPYRHLNPEGQLWVVVVNTLNRLIPKVGRQNNLKFKEIRKRSGHTIYKFTK